MKTLRLIIFISFIPVLILFVGPGTTGCSGGGGGATTEMATTEAAPVLLEQASLAVIGDDDVLRETYEATPDALLTIYDVIEKDRLDGKITAEDSLGQKLSFYYSAPSLREEYQQQTDYSDVPCDTGLVQGFLGELAQLDSDAQGRVIALWEAIIGGTAQPVSGQPATEGQAPAAGDQAAIDAAQAAVAAAQQALQTAVQAAADAALSGDQAAKDAAQVAVAAAQQALQTAMQALQTTLQQAAASASKSAIMVEKAAPYVSKAAPSGGTGSITGAVEFTLPDGSCFQVSNADRPMVAGMTAKEPFVADGKNFEIFYNNQTAGVKDMIKNAFITQGFVQKIKTNISDLDPKAYDAGTKCNPGGSYRIFVTSAGASKRPYTSAFGSAATKQPTYSYIMIPAAFINKGENVQFLRYNGSQPLSIGQDLANGVAAHEWYHAASKVVFLDPCEEALATAAMEWFAQTKTPMIQIPFHLYSPATSLCSNKARKNYGSALFFMFLKDQLGNFTPIQEYIKSLLAYATSAGSAGTKFLSALKAASTVTGFPATFQRFADSGLNLKYSDVFKPPYNYRFTGDDNPGYNDEFLGAGGIPHLPLTWGTYRENLKFQLLPLGILYLAAVTGEGNNWNNYFKVTFNKWAGSASVFGIKIDNNNPQDYTVVYYNSYDQKSSSPEIEGCFDKVDNEPDVLILVFSNPFEPGSKALAADVTIESRAFCKSFPLQVKVNTDVPKVTDTQGGSYELHSEAALNTLMDSKWNGEWYSTPSVQWPGLRGGQFNWESPQINDNGAESSIAWSIGTPMVTWSHNETDVSHPIPACTKTVTTSPTGNTTIVLVDPTDIIKFNVWPWGAPNFSLQPGAFYVSTVLKNYGEELTITNGMQHVTTCGGTCQVGVPPNVTTYCTNGDTNIVDAIISIPSWGWDDMAKMAYTNGSTTLAGSLPLPKSNPTDPTVKNSWIINAPEPLEVHNSTRYLTYVPESGLSYPDKLSYEIIAPVLDEIYNPQVNYLKTLNR